MPLSSYPQFLQTGPPAVPASACPPAATTPPYIPDLDPITNAHIFNEPAFFDSLALWAAANPLPDASGASYVFNGLINKSDLTQPQIDGALNAMQQELLTAPTQANRWYYFTTGIGNYQTNYLLRAAIAQFGFGANQPSDAVYVNTAPGALNGATSSYTIHFAPGQTPPFVTTSTGEFGFWSITPYDNDGFMLPNSAGRYSVGSKSGLVPNPDGSLDLYLQTSQPHTMQTNWLPIPAQPFSLTLRIYWPEQKVLNDEWVPPIVTPSTALR